MMQQGSYQFETLTSRHLEADLLAERAQLRLENFIEVLNRHGFPAQGNILEVGCAQGIRTKLMAEHFPDAKIIGIDRSIELLSITNTNHTQFTNLSFQQADLYELPFPDESFDFIYTRLVFMHLTNPLRALQSLQRVLRPGGRLLIEDADRDCMFFEPAPANFKAFWQKVQVGQQRLGGDPNVGRKLAPYLKEVGFQNLEIEIQPIIGDGKEIAFLTRTLLPSLNLYLEPADRAEGEKIIAELFNLSQSTYASFYHFWFVVSGEKIAT